MDVLMHKSKIQSLNSCDMTSLSSSHCAWSNTTGRYLILLRISLTKST